MRTKPFDRVLAATATRLGLNPEENLLQTTADALALYLSDRLREAWEQLDWPWTRALEARVYAPRWDDLEPSEVDAGDLIFHAGQYWEAQVPNPPTEPQEGTDWMASAPPARMVPLRQEGKTAISEVLRVWDGEPRGKSCAGLLGWELTEEGLQLEKHAPNEVWIEFSLECPRFSATPWSAGITYAADAVCYHNKECWRALKPSMDHPPADGEWWEQQMFPYALTRFCELAACADALDEDQKHDKARAVEAKAYRALDDELAKHTLKQGQTRPYSVRTQ